MKSASPRAWRCQAPLKAQSAMPEVKAQSVKACALLLAALTLSPLTLGARAQVALDESPRAPGGVQVDERGPGGGVYLENTKNAGVSLVPSRRLSDAAGDGAWLSELKAGTLSLDEAWARGYLKAGNVLEIAGTWRDWSAQGKRLRVELVRSLAERAPEVLSLKSPDTLGDWKRMVGVGYQLQKDERAVLWYEAALGDLQSRRERQGQQSSVGELVGRAERPVLERGLYGRATSEGELAWVDALGGLASFYAEMGQTEKAAQTWERAGDYSRHPDWIADAMLEAARAYAKMGETEKSKALYAQIPQYGHSWISALSLYDQAMQLMSAGKLDQARELMAQPLVFTQVPNDGIIAQNAWLASLAYQQGDLDAAFRYAEKVVETAKAGDSKRASVNSLRDMAIDIYNRAGGWKNQPIQTDTKEVVFQANPLQPEQPLYARFRIKTYGDKSITASVDNPHIQARVLPVNNWQREGMSAQEEEMEVIVQSNSLKSFKDVPLVLSSATRGKTTTVRLSLVDKSA